MGTGKGVEDRSQALDDVNICQFVCRRGLARRSAGRDIMVFNLEDMSPFGRISCEIMSVYISGKDLYTT